MTNKWINLEEKKERKKTLAFLIDLMGISDSIIYRHHGIFKSFELL